MTRSNNAVDRIRDAVDVSFEIALPDAYYVPSFVREGDVYFSIPLDIASELRNPVIGVPREISSGDALIEPATVPEIAVDEHDAPG